MKKRLITTCKAILAMLATFGLLLLSINPAAAAVESSVTIVPNVGAPNSGFFVLNVAATDTVIVDLYAVAPVTGAKTRINLRPVTYDGPVDGLVLGNTFSNLPVGTTVFGCIIKDNVASCDTYVVPDAPPPPVDTDKDGVTDDKDECVNQAGPASNGGCPLPVDTDKDGLTDDVDNCDNEAGPASNGGCPVPVPVPVDTDKDGVTDDKDECVNQAGPASNNGCPKVVNEQVCTPLNSGKIDVIGEQTTVVLTAPEGMVITGYCVKAGSANQDEGPKSPDLTPDQLNKNSITISHPSGKAISHYSFSWGPAPVPDACPEMEGYQTPGTDCAPVVVPSVCPPGLGWKDANDNGKVDEGECHKRTGPIAGPPVVTPPAVTPPVTPPAGTPPAVAPAPAAPAAVVPAAVTPVTVPVESTSVVTGADETNGRGVTAETAAAGVFDSESAIADTENQWGGSLAGLAILLLVAVAAKRARLMSSK